KFTGMFNKKDNNTYVPGLERYKIQQSVSNNVKIVKYDKQNKKIFFNIQFTPHQIYKIYDYYSPNEELIKLNNDISVMKINEFSKEETYKYLNKEGVLDDIKIVLIKLLLNIEINE